MMIFDNDKKREARIVLLLRDGVRSGVEISLICCISPGRVYGLLADMEKQNVVGSYWQGAIFPRRRIYWLRR